MGQKMSDVINGLVGPLIKDKTQKNKERKTHSEFESHLQATSVEL